MPRTAARVDANQSSIVDALRRAGAKVQPLHQVGKGCPDLLVAFRGRWYLGEIKDGKKPPSKRKLTPDEANWHELFGAAAPVYVWESEEDALRTLCAI